MTAAIVGFGKVCSRWSRSANSCSVAIVCSLSLGGRVDGGRFLQVHACAKGDTRPGEHDRADSLVDAHLVDGIAQIAPRARAKVHCVASGRFESENRDRPAIVAD